MKHLRSYRAFVAIAMMLIGWLPSLAHDFGVNGIFFNVISTTEVEVTYKGDSYDSYSNEYAGDVVIPSSVNYNGTTYSVTSIGVRAFEDCESLTSIEIPNSVTSIGNYAFYRCESLTSIEIPNSVTSIGYAAFYRCESLTSIEIPNSVTRIGSSAFQYCESLTSIEIPNSVTRIGSSAFQYCESLTSIQIPNSVTSIGEWAFEDCESLTSIQIPNSVTSIGNYAFNSCESLTSIEIPNSVTSIGYDAFSNCSSLTSIVVDAGNTKYDSRNGCNAIIETASNTLIAGCQNTIIPNSVTSIGNSAFEGCALTSIEIPNSVTSIGEWAFYGCSSLTSIQIPNSLTSIGRGVFSECSSLTSIEIPNSVTSIGNNAFNGCALTSIEIPNSVTSIGEWAFEDCESLTSIQIPNSVTSIGNYAFNSCSSLTSIVVDSSNAVYDSRNGCNAIIETASNTLIVGCQNTIIPNSVTSIGEDAFSGCTSLTSIEIGNSVTSIGDDAFSGCSSLTSVVWNAIKCSNFDSDDIPFENCPNITSFTFGDEVEHIPAYLCYNLSSLTSIQIPNSITSIGYHAFSDCESLTSVVWNAKKCSDFSSSSRPFENSPNITSFTLGDEVEHIPAYLCYNLSSLTSIEIPNSVTGIGNSAFKGCDSLTSVVWYAIKCSDFDSYDIPFKNCPNITSFTFGNEVEHIPEYLCYNLSSLTSIEIGNSVTRIGDSAFGGCDNLTSVVWNVKKCSDFDSYDIPFKNCPNITSFTFGDEVEHIPAYLCYNLSKLPSIEIPNSVTRIGDSAFGGCKSLTSIQIGKSVTSIGYGAFQSCSSLTSVVWNVKKCSDFSSSSRPFENSPNITSFTFGDEVEHIPAYLCYNLSSLTSIEIPNSVTGIGNSAFHDCSSLTSIEIPNSVTSIGDGAFWNCTSLTSIEIPNSVTGIGNSAFHDCSSLTSIEIGNSVTSIGDGAFWNCTSLTSIQIPNSVTSIGGSAFEGCENLTSVVWNVKKCSDFSSSSRPFENSPNITSFTFGDEVEHIPAYLCYRMENLTNIEIPNSVISIGESAFSNGERLIIAVLGNSLTSIEKDAFKGCDNIKKIESKATKAPTIENEDQFSENVYTNADLFVPIGYEDNYKYAYAWSEFHNIKGKDFSVKATSISLDKNEVSLKPTQTVVLTETIQPYDTSNKKVTWSSSDDNIAKVDTNGLVTAIAVGEATITATTTDGSNLSATCKVTVVPTLAEIITLDKTEISFEATETATLVATVLPELTTNKSVTWKSSNEAVAVVDDNGEVTAIALGEAIITATTTDGSNLSASCKVIVVPTLAVSIELDKTEASVEEKSDLQLTATILPEHTTNKEVAWSSSDNLVATVDNTGLVTIHLAGEVIITATTTDGSNLSATCRINVYSGIDGVNGDNVIVATIGDNIVVKNAPLGSVVNVYSSNGALIKSMTATDGSVVIEAPIKGIYVVAIDGKSFKVMVK